VTANVIHPRNNGMWMYVKVETAGTAQQCLMCGRRADVLLALRDRGYQRPCGHMNDMMSAH